MSGAGMHAAEREWRREAVDREVEAFVFRHQEEREALWRAYVLATVGYAAPLLLDVLAAEGLGLRALVDAMAPPFGWPRGATGRSWSPAPFAAAGFSARGRGGSRRFARGASKGGVVVRSSMHERGAFIVWVTGDSLSVRYDLGAATLLVTGGDAHLCMPDDVPEAMLTAAPGNWLDDIVDHPLLNRRRYLVRRLIDLDRGCGRALAFRCGLVGIDILGREGVA